MKLFVSSCFAFLIGVMANGQSMEVIAAKKFFTIDKADSTWHDFSIGVRNISSKTVPARVRVDKSKLASNHRVKFCFAMECYDETTVESSAGGGVSTLGPGESDTSTFFGEFRADGTNGTSLATFTFFSNSNQDDKVAVELTFAVGGATTVENTDNNLQPICTPNPAQDAFTVHVDPSESQSWTVSVVDIHGSSRTFSVQGLDSVTLSAADLASGVYSVVVSSATTYRTSRLVVAH